MQYEKIRTIHVYLEEEETPIEGSETNLMESDDPQPQPTRHVALGIFCGVFLSFLCVAIPVASLTLPQRYQNIYDMSIAKNITLTLSQQPKVGQLPLYILPAFSVKRQMMVMASGSFHQDATRATGLITFYNGAFATQTVPAGSSLTGKDGRTVVIEQTAVIPPATATTPPTYGTVSVIARSSVAGAAGNIPANDIDEACCGASILAQNLDAFSGGRDAQDIPVLTQSDLTGSRQTLTAQVDNASNAQAEQERRPGYILLPLDCATVFSASHRAGDHVSSSLLMLTKTCKPLAYLAVDIEKVAQFSITIPRDYHLVSLSALVVQSSIATEGGIITVHVIAYLKHNIAAINTYHFPGK